MLNKVAAVVPAFNEELTILNVLKTILDSGYFDEVIVVDGNSTDKTAEISEKAGVRVIKESKREGKGMAMKKGLQASEAEIIVFFDADLIGLKKEHISLILLPVLNNEVSMCTGARGHWAGLPYVISKIDPLLAIGGERAIKKHILENIPEKFIQGFTVEMALNYYCKVKKIPTRIVKLNGLKLVPKEKKWGVGKGFTERLTEIWQLIKMRFIIIFSKNEFK